MRRKYIRHMSPKKRLSLCPLVRVEGLFLPCCSSRVRGILQRWALVCRPIPRQKRKTFLSEVTRETPAALRLNRSRKKFRNNAFASQDLVTTFFLLPALWLLEKKLFAAGKIKVAHCYCVGRARLHEAAFACGPVPKVKCL